MVKSSKRPKKAKKAEPSMVRLEDIPKRKKSKISKLTLGNTTKKKRHKYTNTEKTKEIHRSNKQNSKGQYGKEGQKLRRPTGRPKGSKNKITRDMKELFLTVLESAGGKRFMIGFANEYPVEFMNLIGKMIPKDMKLETSVKPKTLAQIGRLRKKIREKADALES